VTLQRIARSSRPGEFHPEPLTEPDVRLSPHPAHVIRRRLPPSIMCLVLPGEPVDKTRCG
jgi:hypothetical protein